MSKLTLVIAILASGSHSNIVPASAKPSMDQRGRNLWYSVGCVWVSVSARSCSLGSWARCWALSCARFVKSDCGGLGSPGKPVISRCGGRPVIWLALW